MGWWRMFVVIVGTRRRRRRRRRGSSSGGGKRRRQMTLLEGQDTIIVMIPLAMSVATVAVRRILIVPNNDGVIPVSLQLIQ